MPCEQRLLLTSVWIDHEGTASRPPVLSSTDLACRLRPCLQAASFPSGCAGASGNYKEVSGFLYIVNFAPQVHFYLGICAASHPLGKLRCWTLATS